MIILPAIDLKGGVCVRLRQGRADDVTTYNDDPAAQARDWRDQGGRELHVVDLDGAFAGTPRHADVIRTIIAAFGGPVEVGGGIRTPETLASVLAAGATRAISDRRRSRTPRSSRAPWMSTATAWLWASTRAAASCRRAGG